MAHLHDRIDFTVTVYVVHAGRVLLRMHEKYHQWFGPGGHVELDEDPNQAAVREVKEEVGLDVELWDGMRTLVWTGENVQLIPPVALCRHYTSSSHEHVDPVYFARAQSDAVRVEYDGDRSDEWRWLSDEELETLQLRSDVRTLAREALRVLSK